MVSRTLRADMLVRNADGWPVAVVEVKNRQQLSGKVAAEFHRFMAAGNVFPRVPYVLVLSQDIGFLWKQREQGVFDFLPTYEFPMESVVARYLPHLTPHERLRGVELELLVLHWLNELTDRQDVEGEPEMTLARAGFLDAIRGGEVSLQAAL